jgi:hypothetical protein
MGSPSLNNIQAIYPIHVNVAKGPAKATSTLARLPAVDDTARVAVPILLLTLELLADRVLQPVQHVIHLFATVADAAIVIAIARPGIGNVNVHVVVPLSVPSGQVDLAKMLAGRL